jgi:hypothetical protein
MQVLFFSLAFFFRSMNERFNQNKTLSMDNNHPNERTNQRTNQPTTVTPPKQAQACLAELRAVLMVATKGWQVARLSGLNDKLALSLRTFLVDSDLRELRYM